MLFKIWFLNVIQMLKILPSCQHCSTTSERSYNIFVVVKHTEYNKFYDKKHYLHSNKPIFHENIINISQRTSYRCYNKHYKTTCVTE